MNFGISLGKKVINCGERMAVSELEKMYGKQIGITAPNGNRTFQRIVNGEKITTAVNRDFREIGQVAQKSRVSYEGSSKKIKKNADGDIVEVSQSRWATNFRKSNRLNLETGETTTNVFNCTPKKYFVTKTHIDRSGKVTQKTKNVKIKGKESPLDPPDVKP